MPKIRVNISVDEKLLKQAKKKLDLFGGKLSTLFNAYLSDFVSAIDAPLSKDREDILKRIEELERKVKKLDINK